MARTRANMQLNKEDTYFLNNLMNRTQWYHARDMFKDNELSDEDWYMISDYLFRLAKDYTAYANNKKMREKKKDERVKDVKKCAESILKLAGLEVNDES